MVGVRIDGKDKLGYTQFDSYPAGLGLDVVKFLRKVKRRKTGFHTLVGQALALRVVDDSDDAYPTAEEAEALKGFADVKVASGELSSWYVLLRELQGDLEGCLEAGYICGNAKFMRDSLFCEWAYILNLDTGKLEVYKGFQKFPDLKSRYSRRLSKKDEYCGVALVAEFPLDNIPRNWRKQLPKDE